MSAFDPWLIAACLGGLALLATVRLSAPGLQEASLGRVGNLLSHSAWLLPVMLGMPMALGLMMIGSLSPWPTLSAELLAPYGDWAKRTGFLVAIVVDLWMLWAASSAALSFAAAEERVRLRGLHLVNFVVGGGFLLLFYALHH